MLKSYFKVIMAVCRGCVDQTSANVSGHMTGWQQGALLITGCRMSVLYVS